MFSILIIGFFVFWYTVIYIGLNVFLNHFKFKSNHFLFDEASLSKIVKDNVHSEEHEQPVHSIESVSGSDETNGNNNTSEAARDLDDIAKVLEALNGKYSGHINQSTTNNGSEFIWFNYGGSFSKIRIVHSSLTEFVAIIRFPFGNQWMYTGPLPQETYAFVMKGDLQICTGDISTTAISRGKYESFQVPTMNASAINVRDQCIVLVYARGILPFSVPSIIMDCFFKSLNFLQLFKLLFSITRCTINEIIWNQKV